MKTTNRPRNRRHLVAWSTSLGLLLSMAATLCGCASRTSRPTPCFAIEVVDEQTGRGVPLAELTTVNNVSYWTDSNGLIAFYEPGLMDREVFFHVRSHGYEHPKDFFDNRGVKLRPVAGGRAVVKLKRLNIAERLYRVTGGGIYRDTVLLGRPAPLQEPVLSGQVFGQDTVIATPYRGRIYWFWGDTDRPSYPLGNFGASGATSELPGRGGLDPAVGVDLDYFTDGTGFAKPMCPDSEFGEGLKWIEGLMTLRDDSGRERLLARVAVMKDLGRANAWHLAMFDDRKESFESVARWEIHDGHDSAHPSRVVVGDTEYFYLYPDLRVKADLESLKNLDAYEAFTCLAPAAGDNPPEVLRDRDGRPRYEWRPGAERLDGSRLRRLISSGRLKPDEAWTQTRDIETGRPVPLDRGSVCWNEHRRRWVRIASGRPGEIWFAEADTPAGPWVYARRVVAHDAYNFYNPTQHPFFDQQAGRVIYFEGTYTAAFSDAKAKTPRYDYNQIMYRLDLDDPRLSLPAPVYLVREPGDPPRWMMRDDVEAARAWPRVESQPFFAVPADRPAEGLVPIWSHMENGVTLLRGDRPPGDKSQPLFFALAPTTGLQTADANPAVVPLYEYRRPRDGERLYSTQSDLRSSEWERASEPLCRVWENPMALLILDRQAEPATRGP
jgi:hypothetical protein